MSQKSMRSPTDRLFQMIICLKDRISTEPIDSVSSPTLAVRAAPHDDLVMEEPGPYSAPIPGAIRQN